MKNFKTIITALITPFKDNKIDFNSLEKLVKLQIQGGVKGFVVNGTTAESPTLEENEVELIFKFVRNLVPSTIPLILGTGSNCTKKTIQNTALASKYKADAALVVVPYYNKPPQRGMIKHFEMIAESSEVPIILYNVPSRTQTSLNLSSIKILSGHANIIGIKEASGNIEFAKEIKSNCPEDFILLSGDDSTFAEFLEIGGHGTISVASHIIPNIYVDLLNRKIGVNEFQKFKKLINILFTESNPIPVKKAMKLMNVIISDELRPPLCSLEENSTRDLLNELEYLEII